MKKEKIKMNSAKNDEKQELSKEDAKEGKFMIISSNMNVIRLMKMGCSTV